MKKIFILPFVLALILSSCSKIDKKSVPPIPNLNFTGNVSVYFNNYNIECDIENVIADGCTLTIKEPELLSGLKIKVKDEHCTFEIGNVKYEIDSSILKNTEFALSFKEVLEEVLVTTQYERMSDGNWKYSGQINKGNFTLIQDGKSGYPISLDVPEIKLNVKFYNMKTNSGG